MDNDVVLNVSGRLGNILFTVAAGVSYKIGHNKDNVYCVVDKYTVDNFGYLYDRYWKCFNLPPMLDRKLSCTVISGDLRQIYVPLPHVEGNVMLEHLVETEKYFHHKDIPRELFQCPGDVEANIRESFPHIDECVGISIRGGDYLKYQNVFLIPEINWYFDVYHKYFEGKKAIIFTDDIEYVTAEINKKGIDADWDKFVLYNPKRYGSDLYTIDNPIENLYTMALCRHHICSCSTWAWWGARLAERDDSVNIFPDKRFVSSSNIRSDDYIPDRWTKEKADYINPVV